MTRLDDALEGALAGLDPRPFFDVLERLSKLPGPRPNLDLLRMVAGRIAAAGRAGAPLTERMLTEPHPAHLRTAAFTFAAQAVAPGTRTRGLARLHDLADEPVKERRDAVEDALADVVAALGDEGVQALAPFMDGFLHAHVALEALTTARALERQTSSANITARLAEAFELADSAPRAAERLQGLRLLREGMPEQIVRASMRFKDLVAFVEARTATEHPKTRDVVAKTISMLRKVLGDGRAAVLRSQLEATAKPPRDPSRIVAGMRNRSRGR